MRPLQSELALREQHIHRFSQRVVAKVEGEFFGKEERVWRVSAVPVERAAGYPAFAVATCLDVRLAGDNDTLLVVGDAKLEFLQRVVVETRQTFHCLVVVNPRTRIEKR